MPPVNGIKNISAPTNTTSPTQWQTLSKSKEPLDNGKTYSNRHFPVKVLHNLNILRQNSRFCDVSIVAGGKLLKVCRLYYHRLKLMFTLLILIG